MRNTIVALFISLGILVPALASAHGGGSSKPPKDTTPPSIAGIHIESSGADHSRATAGDTVTLTFTASEKVTPIVLVETHTLFVRAANTSGNTWTASYTVDSRDPTGRVDYLLTLADASKNVTICSSIRLPFIKYCPTTDGSSVTVYKGTTPPPPPPQDATPPVIAPHADIEATTTGESAEVGYDLPAATDDIDGPVGVTCEPESGSEFPLGTTPVLCSASDTAGNTATSTFGVTVTQELPPPPPEPTPYTMAGQADESYLCGEPVNKSWRFCDVAGTFGFTDDFGPTRAIDLGQGSNMGTGTIQSVTLSKDPSYGEINGFHPWQVTISCRVGASASAGACADWPSMSDTVHLNPSGDGVHWAADFSAQGRAFNQGEYYTLTIDDTGWETPAYGSQSLLEPYWIITGLR